MTNLTLTRLDWDTFADATFTRDERARELGRELAATVTPPIVLARKARHRKPNRRRQVIAKAGAALLSLAALLVLAGTARSVPTAPAFYGITPSQASHLATVLEAPGYQLTAATSQRPYWNGRGAYTSGVEPMCYPADRGHWAIAGPPGHSFRVVCIALGGYDVWTVQS